MLLLNSLATTERLVKVQVSDRHLRMELPDRTILSRLLDATFPDTERFLNEKRPNVYTLNTAGFNTMMKRIIALADKPDKATATITIAGDSLTASYSNPDYGTTTDFIPVNRVSGKQEVAFKANAAYLIGLTGMIGAETTTISIAAPNDGILLEEPLFNDRMIFMPVRM